VAVPAIANANNDEQDAIPPAIKMNRRPTASIIAIDVIIATMVKIDEIVDTRNGCAKPTCRKRMIEYPLMNAIPDMDQRIVVITTTIDRRRSLPLKS